MSEAERGVHEKPKRRCDCCSADVAGYWVCANCHGDCGDGISFENLIRLARIEQAAKVAEELRHGDFATDYNTYEYRMSGPRGLTVEQAIRELKDGNEGKG